MASKTKVLLVEDESLIAMGIANQLRKLGYEVPAHASTAEAAIRRESEEKPDCILMDLRLAGEGDGVDAAEAILKRRSVPIVFMTGYSSPETRERCLKLGPCAFIDKPVTMARVTAAIEASIARCGPE